MTDLTVITTLTTATPRQHRRAAMRKRNGWCIWSPWSGYLSSTFACTRTECIKLFERDSDTPWRRYREQGFECRPVLFVDARNESGDACIERPHALHPADAGSGCRAAAAGTGGTEHCVMDDYDSGPDWRQAEEIEEQRWHEEHEEHGNDEH